MSDHIPDAGKMVPDACPFCGAAPIDTWIRRIRWFECGTMVGLDNNRRDQTHRCVKAEVAQLTKERDEALKCVKSESESRWVLAEAAVNSCAEMASHIKRLEEAGDALNGDVKALKAILADMGAKGTMGNASMEGWKKAKEARL